MVSFHTKEMLCNGQAGPNLLVDAPPPLRA